MKLTNENYVDLAEKAIGKMRDEKEKNPRVKLVTTTKLRGLLSMLADIYNDIQNRAGEYLDKEICARIDYLRVRFVYESGKEIVVKDFVRNTNLLEYLKEINGNRSAFVTFYHYMEALVAYFKFWGLDSDR